MEATDDAALVFIGRYCVDSVEHECKCGDNSLPILILENDDGTTDSVKLFDKDFNDDEILNMKDLHGDSSETTYQIF